MTPEEVNNHIGELNREISGHKRELEEYRSECMALKEENDRLRKLLKALCEVIIQELA